LHTEIFAVKSHDAVLVKDLLCKLLATAVCVPGILLGLIYTERHRRKEHKLGVLALIEIARDKNHHTGRF